MGHSLQAPPVQFSQHVCAGRHALAFVVRGNATDRACVDTREVACYVPRRDSCKVTVIMRILKQTVSFTWLVAAFLTVTIMVSAMPRPQSIGRIIVPEEMMKKKLVRQTNPSFVTSDPVIQKLLQSRTNAKVRFRVVLDGTGKVSEIHSLSGLPRLITLSRGAVKQSQYEPSFFDGEPVEVETTVTVYWNFGP